MARGLAGVLLVLLVLLTLACEGGEQPPPPSPVATTTPSVTASPDATATPAPAATPEPVTPAATATATPSPTPTPTPTPVPTPPAVTVTGPLLVFSDALEPRRNQREKTDEEGRVLAETAEAVNRVYIYDLGSDKLWTAFDYLHAVFVSIAGYSTGWGSVVSVHGISIDRSAVQLAGTSLIVWSEGQIRRVGLNGETEAVLFEHEEITWFEVSPDGTTVAVMYGAPTWFQDRVPLVVLDTSTGEELLHTSSRFAPLSMWSDGSSPRPRWNADGTALLIAEDDAQQLLTLDGEFHTVPEDWILSPDLRYALRFGEEAGVIRFNRHESSTVWQSFDVIDVGTGGVLWTVEAEEGGGLYRHLNWSGDSWWGPGPARETRWEGPHVAFRELTPDPAWKGVEVAAPGAPKVLDAETGDVQPLNDETRRMLESPVSTCSFAGPCQVSYDGRIIWKGIRAEAGGIRYLGLIDLAEGPLVLSGVTPRELGAGSSTLVPPHREDIVGPLLVYGIRDVGFGTDQGGNAFGQETWRVMVYDESTGSQWQALGHPLSSLVYWGDILVQSARGGLVVWRTPDLTYRTPDGSARTLHSRWVEEFRVSPDGEKVAVVLREPVHGQYDGSGYTHTVLVLDVRSGDEILRIRDEEFIGKAILDMAGLDDPEDVGLRLSDWGVNGWSVDGNSVALTLLRFGFSYDPRLPGGLLTTAGKFRQLPLAVEEDGSNLAPDTRHIVRGKLGRSDQYTSGDWRSFDIIDFETDRSPLVAWRPPTSSGTTTGSGRPLTSSPGRVERGRICSASISSRSTRGASAPMSPSST